MFILANIVVVLLDITDNGLNKLHRCRQPFQMLHPFSLFVVCHLATLCFKNCLDILVISSMM